MWRFLTVLSVVSCSTPEQTPACKQYIQCYDSTTNSATGLVELQQLYGPEGSCWEEKDEAQCTALCEAGSEDLFMLTGDPACGTWPGGPPRDGDYAVERTYPVDSECEYVPPNHNELDLANSSGEYVVTFGLSATSSLECESTSEGYDCEDEDGQLRAELEVLSWSHVKVLFTLETDDCTRTSSYLLVHEDALSLETPVE